MKGLLFVYVLTYGGAAAALVRPYVGLLIYVCFAIMRPEYLWYWSVPEGNYSRIVALGMLGGWILNGMGNWKLNRATGTTCALLFYLVWAIQRAITAPNEEVAWRITESLAKIIIPFVVGITLIDSIDKIKQLAWVILLSSGYLSLELSLSCSAGSINLVEDGYSGLGRAVLGAGLDCCIWLAYFIATSEGTAWWQRLVAAACGVSIGSAICFTFSRGAMLGLLVAGIIIFILIKKSARHYLGFGAAVLVGAALAGPQVRDRFTMIFAEQKDRDASAQSRLDLWKNCLTLMSEQPLMGIGPGHFILVSQQFGWETPKEAHSTWLQTGAELGVPGMAALLTFHGWTLYRLLQMVRSRGETLDPWCQILAYAVIAGLIGFMIAAVFVTIYELENPYYLVLLGAGILKVSSRKEVSEGDALADSQATSPQLGGLGHYHQMDFQRSWTR
jgi:putative inorganic carbon (hco3(-)) transporter